MSKGNPIVKARAPRDLLAAIDAATTSVRRERGGAAHTRIAFIVEAIRAKLRDDAGEPMDYVDWVRINRRALNRERVLRKAS